MTISFINPNFNGTNCDCTQICGTNVVCQDKGNQTSKVVLQNNTDFEILKHYVDGCLIKNSEACDFLLEIKKPLSTDKANSQKVEDFHYYEYYIEVKGSDLKKAYEQILATVSKLSKVKQECLKSEQHQRKGFISCTRVPKIDTTIQNLKSKAQRQYKMEIIVKSGALERTLK